MDEPKCDLKNIRTFVGREGYGLNADLYINGVKCIFCRDDASGGMMDFDELYFNNPKSEIIKANIKLLKDYLETLPEEKMWRDDKETDPFLMPDGSQMTMKVDLECYVNNLVMKVEKQKLEKKFRKLCETAIVMGVPNSPQYSYINYKKPLLTVPNRQVLFSSAMVKYCSKGVVILNTNLTELGITLPIEKIGKKTFNV